MGEGEGEGGEGGRAYVYTSEYMLASICEEISVCKYIRMHLCACVHVCPVEHFYSASIYLMRIFFY